MTFSRDSSVCLVKRWAALVSLLQALLLARGPLALQIHSAFIEAFNGDSRIRVTKGGQNEREKERKEKGKKRTKGEKEAKTCNGQRLP